MFGFLLLTLMPLLAAARYAAASCAATCGREIAAAALPLIVHRCWAAVAIRTLYFFSVFFFVCRVAPYPHTPPHFRRRRLQDFVYLLLRKHTLILVGRAVGRQLTFFSGNTVFFWRKDSICFFKYKVST